MARTWLFKTEPKTYSFEDLVRDKKTAWGGIRNYQARNYLRTAQAGDLVLIYHTGDEKRVMGVARIASDPYPDEDWVQVDLTPHVAFSKPVSLEELRNEPNLSELVLLKQGRLSVTPVTEKEFSVITKKGAM